MLFLSSGHNAWVISKRKQPGREKKEKRTISVQTVLSPQDRFLVAYFKTS